MIVKETQVMKIKNLLAVLMCVLVFVSPPAFAGFDDFQTESQKMTDLIKCPKPELTKAGAYYYSDLYSCVSLGTEVVQIFITATNDNKSVKHIKVMWIDWTKDVGYGLHTDKEIAEAWVETIATKYAPKQVAEVLEAFRGVSDKIISNENYTLSYTYYVGPSIDERLIKITAK
jgi:hypothetical protein